MKYDHIHSVEQLSLLLQYISIITLIIGLPSVGMYLKRDKRFRIATIIYLAIIGMLIITYNKGNKMLFPDITIT